MLYASLNRARVLQKASPFGLGLLMLFLMQIRITLFDVAKGKVERDLEQWGPLVAWLGE